MRKTLTLVTKAAPIWMAIAILLLMTVITMAMAGQDRMFALSSAEEEEWNVYCRDYKSPTEITWRGEGSEALLYVWCSFAADINGMFVGTRGVGTPFYGVISKGVGGSSWSCAESIHGLLKAKDFNFEEVAKTWRMTGFPRACLTQALKDRGREFSIPNLNVLLGTNIRLIERPQFRS